MPSPTIEDHPLLLEWLNANNAQCLWYVSDWETGRAKPLRHVEAWLVNQRIVLIELRPDTSSGMRGGWDMYTAPDTLSIAETLADANVRVGRAPRITPTTETRMRVRSALSANDFRIEDLTDRQIDVLIHVMTNGGI